MDERLQPPFLKKVDPGIALTTTAANVFSMVFYPKSKKFFGKIRTAYGEIAP